MPQGSGGKPDMFTCQPEEIGLVSHVWVIARVLSELLRILQLVEEGVRDRPECVIFLSAVISCH